jgi:hypothetical protein
MCDCGAFSESLYLSVLPGSKPTSRIFLNEPSMQSVLDVVPIFPSHNKQPQPITKYSNPFVLAQPANRTFPLEYLSTNHQNPPTH